NPASSGGGLYPVSHLLEAVVYLREQRLPADGDRQLLEGGGAAARGPVMRGDVHRADQEENGDGEYESDPDGAKCAERAAVGAGGSAPIGVRGEARRERAPLRWRRGSAGMRGRLGDEGADLPQEPLQVHRLRVEVVAPGCSGMLLV